MSKTSHIRRCKVCKQIIETTDKAVKVSLGTITIEDDHVDFDEKIGRPWGYAHEECFRLAIGDPTGITMLPARDAA